MRHRLRELAVQWRFWGFLGLARSVHYSVLGTWGQLRRARRSRPLEKVGQVISCAARPDGADLELEAARLEIRFLAADLARVTWTPGRLPLPYGLAETDWSGAPVRFEETAEGWRLATGDLHLSVLRDGTLVWATPDGTPLRREAPPERRGEEWHHRASLAPDEAVFGLGEHTGPLDLRGTERRLWNSDPMKSYGPDEDPLYMGIPVLQTLKPSGGYLAFYENSHAADFTFNDEIRARFEGGALRYYLTPGPPEHTLQRYTELTGRPPLPPRWALGYHQSRFSYRTEAEIRDLVQGFRKHNLPLSAIHLDIHYMDGFRVFTVDEDSFPDLKGLAEELDADGIRLVTILDPGVKRDKDYRVFRQGSEGGHFCRTKRGRIATAPVWPGWSAFPDFTRAETRAWWGEQHSVLLERGVTGFWNDMNEPAMVALWGERTLAQDVVHDFDGRGGTHAEAHNLYGMLMARATDEGLRRLDPDRRHFLLTRSGWAGIQRHAWMWTGDISSGWDMLHQTVRTVLGLGLSGMPYSGPDIGGFKGTLGREEYLRWFELAAFLPFFRTHSSQSTEPREPWRFGAEALERVRGLLRLRYALMPYLYTLAWEASRTGHPLVRPVWWGAPGEDRLRSVDDAFLLGPDLLLAPVLGPGERRRRTMLPPGEWYSYWSGERYSAEADVEAPLGRPALFVRGGSVLPLEQDRVLELRLFPSAGVRRVSMLYSDAGGIGAEARVDTFLLEVSDGKLALRRSFTGKGHCPYETIRLSLPKAGNWACDVDGQRVPAEAEGWSVRRDFHTAHFLLPGHD
ncbi:glycoside hydrolase family 31 protein [Nitratireductor thuwali]|uniref:Oligosaccharide 4-alpha-D-glucosyltransferase n=1 Tax=Nitratireductor thuwali TaxID=2267699 RepID=A0ABY5MEU0_9HYPH|nr:Oligosaccharide 4-alpha-D-glucosyltransferase [Nitratireductor thuwali]